MLRRLFHIWRKESAPLVGAPPVRRQKTYSGQSGYVYQYYYEGYRIAHYGASNGTEYVFDVCSGPKPSFPVAVFLADDSVRNWEREHERELSSAERYAVAKIALFRAFDERATPAQMREAVHIRPADIADILETLGID
jgi:hypothetical protein